MTAAVVVSLGLVVGAPGCTSGPELCTPDNAGFGGATRLEERVLFAADRKGPCQPHLEVLRDTFALRIKLKELGTEALPAAVDWSRESVVLREATLQQGLQWLVASGDLVTVGVQGCVGAAAMGCRVTLYTVATVVTRVEAATCEAAPCAAPTGIEGS